MKAIVKEKPGVGAVLKTIEPPKPGPRDVLIRVKAAAICGSDVHAYHGKHPRLTFPRILGRYSTVLHEVAHQAAEALLAEARALVGLGRDGDLGDGRLQCSAQWHAAGDAQEHDLRPGSRNGAAC